MNHYISLHYRRSSACIGGSNAVFRMTNAVFDLMRRAVHEFMNGNPAGAEPLIRKILSVQPRHFDALHLSGIVSASTGNHGHAVASYKKALKINGNHEELRVNLGLALAAIGSYEDALINLNKAAILNPRNSDTYCILGNVQRELGRFDEALANYERALTIQPGNAGAWSNRGVTLHDFKRHDDALASYDRALKIKSDYAEAWNNRGVTLNDLKRYNEALASYERALKAKPDYAEAWSNRGISLSELKRHEDALASFEQALTIRPDFAKAWTNRSVTLNELSRHEDALASDERALRVQPDYAEAWSNRGNTLRFLRRFDEAIASYEKSLTLKPDNAEVWSNRGVVLREIGRNEDGLASIEKALTINPGYLKAHCNRGDTLREMGRHADALKAFLRLRELCPDYEHAVGFEAGLRRYCCDWHNFDEDMACVISGVQTGQRAVVPFTFLAISGSAQDQLACARTFAFHSYPAERNPICEGTPYRHDRIRVAYLSSDFRDHAVAQLMAGLFERHDRQRFETIAVSLGGDAAPTEMRRRLQNAFERFIDVRNMSDREVARMLYEAEIDIAVDLNGFTQNCRTGILALRPAPIQVNYLGYSGTLGAEYCDYIVADRTVIPADQQVNYTESVVYLPDTYMASDMTRRIAAATPRRIDMRLPEHGFIFCSFNNSYKLTPTIFDLWMRLLRRVEGSVLWLSENNSDAMRNLQREASARDVDPARLIFAARAERGEDHLARLRLGDLFLDTLPYNAHTTANDALWAGLPVLTCLGTTFAGRVAASLLNAVGLPELITQSLDEYEGLAYQLATTPGVLADIKAKLARNRTTHALFDTDRFRRHIEAAYVAMWERHQQGEAPASFAVDAIQSTGRLTEV